MEVLKGGLNSFFKEMNKTIDELTYQVNHEILNSYTLDMCITFQNNLIKLKENLEQKRTNIELNLLSIANTNRILENMKKEFAEVLSSTHSG